MLGFLGMATLPGMLITDWYAAGIGHEFGLEGTQAVESHMESTMWGIAGFGMPMPSSASALCLPLITIALSRAGRMPWWSVGVIVPLRGVPVRQPTVRSPLRSPRSSCAATPC